MHVILDLIMESAGREAEMRVSLPHTLARAGKKIAPPNGALKARHAPAGRAIQDCARFR